MSQMSMEDILRDPESPEAETAAEMLGPDERAALDAAREAQAPETPAENDADTPAAEAEPEAAAEAEPEAEPEAAAEAESAESSTEDLSDLPESIRNTLARRPEDAGNWRSLRGIAKDSQKAAAEAAREAAEARSQAARLEAELAQLRRRQAEGMAQTQAAQAAASLPDPDVDPAGYVRAAMASEREQIRAEMRSMQLDTYEAQAKARHGAAKVEEAFTWASQQASSNPEFSAQLNAAADPWDFVVVEKARRETLSEMGDDPAAYLERVRAEAREAALAEIRESEGRATADQVEREIANRLPRSLAKAPGAGGQAVSDGYAGPTPMSQIVGPNSG